MNTVTIDRARTLAISHRMCRKVINLKYDKVDDMYLGLISITGYVSDVAEERTDENVRDEQGYFEVSAKDLSEANASAILIANATYTFLGADMDANSETITKEVAKTKTRKTKAKVVADEPKQVAETAKEETKVETKPKTKKVSKTVPYDRTVEAQKKVFAAEINAVCPTWSKDNKTKLIAKGLSMEFDGKPFLDMKGTVIKAVKDRIVEAFTSLDAETNDL